MCYCVSGWEQIERQDTPGKNLSITRCRSMAISSDVARRSHRPAETRDKRRDQMSNSVKRTVSRISAAMLAAGVLFAGASAANATVILYSTDFNGPTYSNGPLVGQDSWTAHSGAG